MAGGLPGEILGPLFLTFSDRLELHAATVAARPGGTVALFATRGGMRLRGIYERVLESRSHPAPCPHVDFLVSRLSVGVACLLEDLATVAPMLIHEVGLRSVGEMLEILLPAEEYGAVFDRAAWRVAVQGDPRLAEIAAADVMPWTLAAAIERASGLEAHLRTQAALLDAHLDHCLALHPGADPARHAILVDTGWSGSTQRLLMRRYPGIAWHGQYLGRATFGAPVFEHYGAITGLLAEDAARPSRPMSAVLMQRHFIEGSCEARMPSVTGYRRDAEGRLRPFAGPVPANATEPGSGERVYSGILAWLDANAADLAPAEARRLANRAGRRLARITRLPRAREVDALEIAPRSADLGRTYEVSFLLPRASGLSLAERRARVKAVLWREGQAAREFGVYALPILLAVAVSRNAKRRLDQWLDPLVLQTKRRLRWVAGMVRDRLFGALRSAGWDQ